MSPNQDNSIPDKHPSESKPRSRSLKWFLVVPVVLVIAGLVTLLLRSNQSRALAASTAGSAAEPVSITYPQQRTVKGTISLPSTLQAYDDSPIYARTSGYVERWYADLGAHVRKGQLLAVIDAPEVDQELNQAQAMMAQTQANLKLAQITAKRYQELSHTNAVAQQEVDNNNQNLSAQQANLQAAQANVKRLEELQSFEKVTAPFDGVITQRLVNQGDLVNAGNGGSGAQLFHVARINTMRVFIPVPEGLGGQIGPGLAAKLTLTELPGRTFSGSVVRNSHSIDPNSHTLLTEVDVPNPTGELMPGAYADVHLDLAHDQQQLTIPTGAVLFQAAGPQVVLANSSNQLELRKVALGNDLGDSIEVVQGLAPTDRVVASPPDYVVNGMQATIAAQTNPNAANAAPTSTTHQER